MGEPVAVRGHALRLSKTNSYALVPVCECGWYGTTWPSHRKELGDGRLGPRQYELAEKGATAQHAQHAHEARPLTATRPVEQYVGTVLNFRRFGHD